MDSYKCNVCGYLYNPTEGDPDQGIEAGMIFEEISESWTCPLCGAGKGEFKPFEF